MTRFYKVIFTVLLSMAFMLPTYAVITPTPASPVQGCQAGFTTSVQGTQYLWNFGTNSYPRTLQGPALSTAITAFLTPGTHTVRVFVTTNNGVVTDEVTVNVQAGSTAPVLTSNRPVCSLTNPPTRILFTASTGYDQYAFFINDSLYQLDPSRTFNPFLAYGDSVRVFGLTGNCFSAGATLNDRLPLTPTLLSTADNDSICTDQTVVFSIEPSDFDSVLYFVGSSLIQKSTTLTWTTSTLSDNQTVSVHAYKNGCKTYFAGNTRTIDVRLTPSITLEGDPTICQGTPVEFTIHNINTIGSKMLDGYSFSLNSNEVQTGLDSTYNNSALANNDVITATGTMNGCVSKPVSITMNVVTSPSVNLATAGNICKDDTASFIATPAGYSNYQFFNGSVAIQNGTSAELHTTNYKSGDSIYVVATEAGCGSGNSDTIIVSITPSPLVNPGTGSSTCSSSPEFTLTGFGPVGGWWSGTGITDSTAGVFNPAISGPGNFALTYSYTDPESGCTGKASISYLVNAFELVNFFNTLDICVDGARLTASGADTYLWTAADGLNDKLSCRDCPNPIATPLVATKYYLLATSTATGCSDFDSVIVNPNRVDAVSAFTDTTIAPGQAVTFDITVTGERDDRSYAWTPNQFLNDSTLQNPTATPEADVTYTMIVTSGLCTDEVTINVHVVENDTATRFPNAFTPNNDKRNDLFGPVFKENNSASIKEFRIYNRYGQMVHEDTKPWDGKFKGADQPVGTYVYYITVSFPGQPDKVQKGAVTLLR